MSHGDPRRRACPRMPASPGICTRLVPVHQDAPRQATQYTYLQVFSESPLADSNRRPPPDHGGVAADERDSGTALAAAFSCNYAASSVRRVAPRRALSLPERPRTCPQYLSPDPRWTAAETWRRAEADPQDLARPRRSSRTGLHTLARNVDRLRRRCGSARDSRPAVELFQLGGRVAATVRPAFDRESHPAPAPHLHDGSCPMSTERKHDG